MSCPKFATRLYCVEPLRQELVAAELFARLHAPETGQTNNRVSALDYW